MVVCFNFYISFPYCILHFNVVQRWQTCGKYHGSTRKLLPLLLQQHQQQQQHISFEMDLLNAMDLKHFSVAHLCAGLQTAQFDVLCMCLCCQFPMSLSIRYVRSFIVIVSTAIYIVSMDIDFAAHPHRLERFLWWLFLSLHTHTECIATVDGKHHWLRNFFFFLIFLNFILLPLSLFLSLSISDSWFRDAIRTLYNRRVMKLRKQFQIFFHKWIYRIGEKKKEKKTIEIWKHVWFEKKLRTILRAILFFLCWKIMCCCRTGRRGK